MIRSNLVAILASCLLLAVAVNACSDSLKDKLTVCRTYLMYAQVEGGDEGLCRKVYSDSNDQLKCEAVMTLLYPETDFLKSAVDFLKLNTAHDLCFRAMVQAGLKNNFPVQDDCRWTSNTGLRCLWFHGVGQDMNKKGFYLYDSSYWDGLSSALKSICDNVFYTTDSYRAWDDKSMLQEHCDQIEKYRPDIVITHSMGNMVVAAGARLGISGCKKITGQPGGVVWLGSQGPNTGTVAISGLFTVCKIPGLLHILRCLGYCDEEQHLPHSSILSITPDYKSSLSPTCQITCASEGCETLSQTSARLMSGNMCGNNAATAAYGTNVFSLALKLVSSYVGSDWGYDEDTQMTPPYKGNDGMVNLQSCIFTNKNFQPDFNNPYYIMKGNHADGTGRCGDGKEAFLKPVEWFRQRILAVRKSKNLHTHKHTSNLFERQGVEHGKYLQSLRAYEAGARDQETLRAIDRRFSGISKEDFAYGVRVYLNHSRPDALWDTLTDDQVIEWFEHEHYSMRALEQLEK